MGSHRPFGHLKHKLRPKEKLVGLLPTTKSWKSTRLLNMQARCDMSLESFQQGLQFYFRPHHNRRFAPKVTGIPAVGISRLQLGSPRTKSHLDATLVERRRVYYKRQGGGLPQVWAMVSLVCLNCMWLVLAPKVL
jgi:hypothetical protein